MIKKQSEFPLLEKYKSVFQITPQTVFAYNKNIYTNYELSTDLLAHEIVHLARQEELGVDVWVKSFLEIPQFRLEEEVMAYKEQLKYYKDRNYKNKARIEFARHLSSGLYGNIINHENAIKKLR